MDITSQTITGICDANAQMGRSLVELHQQLSAASARAANVHELTHELAVARDRNEKLLEELRLAGETQVRFEKEIDRLNGKCNSCAQTLREVHDAKNAVVDELRSVSANFDKLVGRFSEVEAENVLYRRQLGIAEQEPPA